MTAQFRHYCKGCIYLGSTPQEDFYVHPSVNPEVPGTLLIRNGNEDSEYASIPVGYVPNYGPNPAHPDAAKLHTVTFALANAFYQYMLVQENQNGSG